MLPATCFIAGQFVRYFDSKTKITHDIDEGGE